MNWCRKGQCQHTAANTWPGSCSSALVPNSETVRIGASLCVLYRSSMLLQLARCSVFHKLQAKLQRSNFIPCSLTWQAAAKLDYRRFIQNSDQPDILHLLFLQPLPLVLNSSCPSFTFTVSNYFISASLRQTTYTFLISTLHSAAHVNSFLLYSVVL